MRLDTERFTHYNATVALISVGSPADTAAFCESREIGLPFVCLSDAEKRAYAAYGLSRGTVSELLLSPRLWGRGLRATLHGHFAGLPKGDPFQMPGVFIVDQAGMICYAHFYEDASDNPPNAELFAVLDALSEARGATQK